MMYLSEEEARLKREESLNAEIADAVREIRKRDNIYAVIEQFACICSKCKELTGRAYEAGDYALLQIVKEKENISLDMACWARGLGETLPEEGKWLTRPDARNEIRYTAEHLTGYEAETDITEARNKVFHAYKCGDGHAMSEAQRTETTDEKNTLVMLIHFQ